MKDAPVCDIVVLTWNKVDITRRFIKSFLSHTPLPTRLIIIDNASTDGTPEYLAGLKSEPQCAIQVILNKENYGFVSGMNQGIALTSAPYVCVANNDLLFTDGWLEEMLAVLEKDPQIGLLNPNSNTFGVRAPEGTSVDMFAADLRKSRAGRFVEMPFCIGFLMCVPRKVLAAAGGFSEAFKPMFYEDRDYSLTVAKMGYLIGMAQGAYVWHDEHTSVEQLSDRGEGHFARSRAAFEKKWGRTLRILYLPDGGKVTRDDLEKCIHTVRGGNFVTVAVQDPPMKGRKYEFFKKYGLVRHTGIYFIHHKNILRIIRHIFFKKKKSHALVMPPSAASRFLKLMGVVVFDRFDEKKIEALKYQIAGARGHKSL